MMQLTWLLTIPIILVLLWLAWRRPNRQRLGWRLVASMVAGISLVLLVFPPVTQQAINPSAAILLTEGYNPDTLKALQQQKAKLQVYTYQATSNVNGIPLNALLQLRQHQPGLQTLHVLGYGLPTQELAQLEGLSLQTHLTELPAGLQAVDWPQRVKLGQGVEVNGKYMAKAGKAILYLHAAGQLQDSVTLLPDSSQTFRLRYTPKVKGCAMYTLLQKKGSQTDTLGQLPVHVEEPQPLGVLLLAATPNFEFKFLKNHLGELQHRVAFRATISKNLSQSEWLNMPKTDLNRITPRLLQHFDVVITEPEALQNLSASERSVLQQAVSRDGLGVLSIAAAPATNRSTAFFTSFDTRRVSRQESRSVRASWAGTDAATAIAAPYTLVNAPALSALISESGKNVLAGARKAGWGKVAISLVPQTFPWQLEGKDKVYASYWATLLTAVAKEQVQEQFWQVTQPQFPKPNQPVQLTFTDYTSNGELTTATVTRLADSTSIHMPLAQHMHQPEKFSGDFWPRQSDWHQVQAAGTDPYFFFVQDSTGFTFESIASRRAATQAFAASQRLRQANAALAYRNEPVPLWWFFALFVLSSGFLWLEEKF
ncbi:hypothetical protein [Pontibacter oryzae]|nr:hypothetical protein [Pontibacter oryzae]